MKLGMVDRFNMNTPAPARTRPAQAGSALARVSLGMGLLCAAVALLAGPAYRLGLSSLSAGLLSVRWSAIGALAGLLVALIAAALSRPDGGPASLRLAGLALGVNLLVAVPPLYLYQQVQRLPRIHDISTDTETPPPFVAVVPLRQGARNPVGYAADTAAQQHKGYPDIAPLTLALPPAQAFERAVGVARAMGWQIVAAVPQELRLEATDTSLLFGFKDDVVVRIRPQAQSEPQSQSRVQAQGSLVDVRSLSRVGGSDFGVNAKRVRAFLKGMAAG